MWNFMHAEGLSFEQSVVRRAKVWVTALFQRHVNPGIVLYGCPL